MHQLVMAYRWQIKCGVVDAYKLIESFDAVIAARMPIAVDHDEASAPDNNGGQGGGMTVPPPAYLLLFGTRLLLPASCGASTGCPRIDRGD
jgi:hypothetical protein